MEQYKQALIEKINELNQVQTPLARSRVLILLKLLGELGASK